MKMVWCVFTITNETIGWGVEERYKDLDKIFFRRDDAEEYMEEQSERREAVFEMEEWAVN